MVRGSLKSNGSSRETRIGGESMPDRCDDDVDVDDDDVSSPSPSSLIASRSQSLTTLCLDSTNEFKFFFFLFFFSFFFFSVASSLLNAKQEGELNSAIVEYLVSKGFNATADALMREANCGKPDKSTNLLVKKWTSVVRLQKKVSRGLWRFLFFF